MCRAACLCRVSSFVSSESACGSRRCVSVHLVGVCSRSCSSALGCEFGSSRPCTSAPSSSKARARSARGSACPVQRTHLELGHPTVHLAPGHRLVTGLRRALKPSLQRGASGSHSLCLLPLSRAPQGPAFVHLEPVRSTPSTASPRRPSAPSSAHAPADPSALDPRTVTPERAARFAPSTAPHPSLIACTQALRASTHLDGTPLALRAAAGVRALDAVGSVAESPRGPGVASRAPSALLRPQRGPGRVVARERARGMCKGGRGRAEGGAQGLKGTV